MRDLKDKDFIQQLLSLVTASGDKQTLARVVTDYNKASQALQAESNSANRKNFKEADAEYLEHVAEIANRYMPEETASTGPLEWPEYQDTANKAEVLRQLIALGYQLTQRTFYRHCKQGKCRTGDGGMYTRRLVKQYVQTEGLLRSGMIETDDNGPDIGLALRKQQLENEKLTWHNKKAQLDYDKASGNLIEREGIYLELAARYVALDNAFWQKFDTAAPEMIHAVGGKQTRLVEFSEMMRGMWDELLNSFVSLDEFEVLFNEEDMPS